MTREEAIKQLKSLLAYCERMVSKDDSIFESDCEALKIALSALRPVTREQVEKVWRGEWERIIDPCGELESFLCKYGRQSYSADNFCPSCGMAMSDKAVGLVLERLEALKDEQ